MRAETQASVEAIRKSLNLLAQRMDWDTAPHRLEEMNAMIEDGDLWSDPARAQKLMRDRQVLSDKVETYRRIDRDLKDSVELIELGEAEGDAEIVREAEAALVALRETAADREIASLLAAVHLGPEPRVQRHRGGELLHHRRPGHHVAAAAGERRWPRTARTSPPRCGSWPSRSRTRRRTWSR